MRKSDWILSAACASALASSNLLAAVAIDGTKDADYGTAKAIQTVTTGFGDNGDSSGSSGGGSELDGAYAVIQNGFLNLLFTGNFESNGNHLNLFFADGSAGQNTLNTGSVGNNLTAMNGSKFSAGFAATYVLDINDSGGTVYVNSNTLTASSINSAYLGNFAPNNGTSTTVGGINFSLNNTNTAGVAGGTVGPADQTAAAAVSTGMEIAIPLSSFNTSSGTISILADINGGGNNYLSNQFLPGIGSMSGNVGATSGGSFDFSAAANQFFTIALPATGSVNGTWNTGSSGTWETAANWSGGVPQLAGSRANFTTKNAALVVQMTNDKTCGQLNFNSSTAYTIAANPVAKLTIDDTGDSLGVNPLISVQLGSHTISAPVSVANGVTINTVEATTLAMTGTLSGGGTILHSGAGTLKLAGTNGFTGALNSTAGTLELDSNGGASTATITLGDSNVDNQPAALNIGTTATNIPNAIVTNRDLAANNNLRTISSSGDATLSGAVSLNGGVAFAPAASTTLTVGGLISDGTDTSDQARRAIRASGAGTVVLTQNETNTGDAFVDSGTLVLASTASLQAGSVSVLAGSNFIANGTLSSNVKVYSAGNFQFRGNTSTTSALQISAGTIEIAANGSVSIAQSASAKSPTVLTTGTLSFLDDSSGKIDLKNNTLITTYDQATTQSLLFTKNIVTSTSGGTLGYKDTGDGHTQVQFTKAGDANLDGVVNIGDLGILATNYGKSGQYWGQGDFNYDGVVNIGDLGLLATNYGTGVTSPLPLSFQQALAQVEAQTGVQLPEPSIGLIGMGMLFGARRRRA